jgi:hypothetical protein
MLFLPQRLIILSSDSLFSNRIQINNETEKSPGNYIVYKTGHASKI